MRPSPMKRLIAMTLVFLMGLTLVSFSAAAEAPHYKMGDTIQDFSVTTAAGETIQFYDLLKEKKAVVLNLWYTTCYYCNLEFPVIESVYQAYKDKLEILALSPFDDLDAVAAYQTENSLSFPMGVDVNRALCTAFAVEGYPTTVVIDHYGVICYIHGGVKDCDAKLYTKVQVNAGDVLSFSYRFSGRESTDQLALQIDDELYLYSGDTDWKQIAIEFPTTGEVEIRFKYHKFNSLQAGEDRACLDSIAILTGEDAQKALAAMPVYPRALEGDEVAVEAVAPAATCAYTSTDESLEPPTHPVLYLTS